MNELGRFLEFSGRIFSTSNESYAVFVLEPIEYLGVNDINRKTLRNYLDQVEEILAICRSLSIRWEQKLDEINTRDSHITLQPSLVRSSRGHPHFDISREQLLYLAVMYFSWTDIDLI